MKKDVTIAVIHAPRKPASQIRNLWDALVESAGLSGIRISQILINPDNEGVRRLKSIRVCHRLILVWGAETPPDWYEMARLYCSRDQIVHLVCLDESCLPNASDSASVNDQSLGLGATKQEKITRYFMHSFIAGFFNASAPYGYRKVPLPGKHARRARQGYLKGPFRLEPAGNEEVGIVNYIYESFAEEECARGQIVNTLNAQEVPPSPRGKYWTHKMVTAVLSDPVYIGANRHREFVQHGVFAPIVGKALFYAAQTKLAMEESPWSGFGWTPRCKNLK